MVAASSFRCAYCDRSAYRHVRGDWLCKGHYQDSKGGVTMPKEPKPNFASFTKAELIKIVKKVDTRQTKLLNRIAELEGQLAIAMAMPTAEHEPGPYDVVHVTQGPDTVSDLVPKPAFGSIDKPHADDWQDANQGAVAFCPLCDVNTKPPHCEVLGCPNERASEAAADMHVGLANPAFPWEKD